jgi:SAM-dependent methyltransferase
MGRFWDERAREDAFYFVDNRVPYGGGGEELFWQRGEEELDRILAMLDLALEQDQIVLEIGCGVGRLTRAIAPRVREVLALDVSAEMLELARRHNPGLSSVRWMLGDGKSLAGVGDAAVDVCFSHVVFQHIPEPAVTLGYVREMGRVLRPGGFAAFQLSNDPAVHRPRRRLARAKARALTAVGRGPRGQSNPAWLGSAVELDALEHAAREVSLFIQRIEGAGTQFCLVLARRVTSGPSPG